MTCVHYMCTLISIHDMYTCTCIHLEYTIEYTFFIFFYYMYIYMYTYEYTIECTL